MQLLSVHANVLKCANAFYECVYMCMCVYMRACVHELRRVRVQIGVLSCPYLCA